MGELKGLPRLDTGLLPDYEETRRLWEAAGEKFGLWSYVGQRADPELAAAFSKLFWPDFVEVDGCILLAEHYSAGNFAHWHAHVAGNRPAIEAMINHVHIWDLFPQASRTLPEAVKLDEYLAQFLAMCWKHALLEAFPDKRFTFSYLTTEEGYGPEISFYQAES